VLGQEVSKAETGDGPREEGDLHAKNRSTVGALGLFEGSLKGYHGSPGTWQFEEAENGNDGY